MPVVPAPIDTIRKDDTKDMGFPSESWAFYRPAFQNATED
jgi:hypothetical protein